MKSFRYRKILKIVSWIFYGKLLYDADVELVILRYYIRIAYDQEYISGHTYGVAAKKLTEIGKMLGGFIKSVQN